MKPVILWSDALIFLLVISLALFFWRLRRDPQTRERWAEVFSSRLGMVAFTVIAAYIMVALLDSLHFRRALENPESLATEEVFYDNKVTSVFDVLTGGMGERFERTYSAPFALLSFEKENIKDADGRDIRDFPPLRHAGQHLSHPDERAADILGKSVRALLWGLLLCALVITPQWLLLRGSRFPWLASWTTQAVILCSAVWMVSLSRHYHILGTDQGGADVLFQSLKGIRTGVLLGTLATLVMLPIAVTLGVMAGYFKGWVDDVVQYLYTTLSSIPGILLIAASVLLFQVYIDLNPDFFAVGMEKADAKFIALCFILGVTSWSTLCRLIRAETLKISQLGYVQAAHAFGVSHTRILGRHVLPNVVHIILITFVLDFSALVLAEAVLSYIGVGVDPSMGSWGNMINGARSELSREPTIWWTLTGAFFFMFVLVLAANLFSDLVRDAFDPRTSLRRASA
ncbi:MAG: peptide ABC transporter permease [Haliea sp.]|uniref:ABC transporter permease n=1 Tax=Haliea sp. TaxID=1932666 RepID=UPI000C5BC222|nr:ABC transporter permease [Haliea sp.]MBM69733.1 peptide ABC transporter permease [Haliea sp.]|tara:strand:+ start:72465 stop:73835 length:1371 start_codon:yes stop_codon:yes gene_type:complete